MIMVSCGYGLYALWDPNAPLQDNMNTYGAVLGIGTALLVVIWGVVGSKLRSSRKRKQTKEVIGSIVSIKYAGMKDHDGVRYNITADYLDIQRTFYSVGNEVSFKPEAGDQIVILTDPSDPRSASIDVQASIALKSKTSTASSDSSKSNAMFKVTEITPKFEHAPNTYLVIGEVFPDQGASFQTEIEQVLDKSFVSTIVPGKLLAAYTDGEAFGTVSIVL